eukprot:CAMPEP_0172356906 /NCGR_PEP_ID=MMETSP1060-20121228/1286_1 /TAXON_ID=37318 /ORGANISM="Pseudo-nitzschia pungens, Strain cf. cingulata" /LENGTH=514 /DNA_ID=CAMNT_0013077299 /DNA_START=173 /DNA_END=1714 /DNA_ORIENTATION=+
MNRFISHLRRFSKILMFVGLCSSIEFPVGSTICNDVEYLCDLPVNEILFGMVHNAMSSPSSGFFFFANHMNDPIVESLDEGYRGLSLDLCNCNGDLVFCHGGIEVGCGIGERDPLKTFTEINEWITANPNNVIMIWLQINDNAGDAISLDDVERLVYDVPIGNADVEFADRLYRREEDNEWATLSTLIRNEKQVLFFYMGGPDGREESQIGIHYFYDYGMSTHWSYESVSDLRETVLDGCEIQRDSTNTRDFFMMNAFVTKKLFGYQVQPSRDAAKQVNDGEFLEPLLEVCERTQKSKVNIISVDFWKSGTLVSYVNDRNSKLAMAQNSTVKSPISPSTYVTYPEQPNALEGNVHHSPVTMVPSLDAFDDASAAASRPWSDPGQLNTSSESFPETELPCNVHDCANTTSTPHNSTSPELPLFEDRTSKEKDEHSGEYIVGSSSEQDAPNVVDQSMHSPSDLNPDPEGDTLLEQGSKENIMITARSSTFPLVTGDDDFDGKFDSAAASLLFPSYW